MSLAKLFLTTALATVIGAAAVTAQEGTGAQVHHPGAAEEATAPAAPTTKPMQEAMPGTANSGMPMGPGMMSPGAAGGPDMDMMSGCMGMMGKMMPGMGHGRMATAGPDDPVEAAFAAINSRMHRDMAVPAGGSPDVMFAQAMIAHHQGAIDMAKVILGFGSDPEIRKLAQDVITAQQGEIAFMRQWMVKQPQP
jgi:uncharacterized protein (DUF305 family)